MGNPEGVQAARDELLEVQLAGVLEGHLRVGYRRVRLPPVDGHLGKVPLRLRHRRLVAARPCNLQRLPEQCPCTANVAESLHQEDRQPVQGGALEGGFPLLS